MCAMFAAMLLIYGHTLYTAQKLHQTTSETEIADSQK